MCYAVCSLTCYIVSMPSQHPDPSFHLLRVRVRKGVFERLQEVALEDRCVTGEYTTVSDLVRSAILDWLNTHDAENAMGSFRQPERAFRASGLSLDADLIEPLLDEEE